MRHDAPSSSDVKGAIVSWLPAPPQSLETLLGRLHQVRDAKPLLRRFALINPRLLLERPKYLFSMLSPSNSQSRHIRRSKSSTSVKERQKHPIALAPQDPESARVHALIAAHRAMDRSLVSTSEDLHRSDSSKSNQSARFAHTYHTEIATPAAQLRHQRSILQATTPSLATSLPDPDGTTSARHGPPSLTYATMSEFGSSFDGEKSSYRRLRQVRSVMNPGRG